MSPGRRQVSCAVVGPTKANDPGQCNRLVREKGSERPVRNFCAIPAAAIQPTRRFGILRATAPSPSNATHRVCGPQTRPRRSKVSSGAATGGQTGQDEHGQNGHKAVCLAGASGARRANAADAGDKERQGLPGFFRARLPGNIAAPDLAGDTRNQAQGPVLRPGGSRRPSPSRLTRVLPQPAGALARQQPRFDHSPGFPVAEAISGGSHASVGPGTARAGEKSRQAAVEPDEGVLGHPRG
jgi:hypothetical protein